MHAYKLARNVPVTMQAKAERDDARDVYDIEGEMN
jgi:hypothetical protein